MTVASFRLPRKTQANMLPSFKYMINSLPLFACQQENCVDSPAHSSPQSSHLSTFLTWISQDGEMKTEMKVPDTEVLFGPQTDRCYRFYFLTFEIIPFHVWACKLNERCCFRRD